MKSRSYGLLLLLGAMHSLAQPASPPIWFGDIGERRLADFFPIDIAISTAGKVHYTDVSREAAFRYSASKELELKIAPVPGFAREIAVDSNERIYVSNHSTELRVYAPDGELVDTWTASDDIYVGTVAKVDGHDRIFAGVGFRVVVFDTNGNVVGQFGTRGSAPNQITRVNDIAVAPDGSIWVVDVTQHRLQKFDADGQHLLTVGGPDPGTAPGSFRSPVSVATDSEGNVYVSDRRNYRIQKFDSAGNFVTTWGTKGRGPGQFLESHGLAVGPDDSVWVAGYHAFSIQRFDSDGNLLDFWQDHISGPGEFTEIRGVGLLDGILFATDYWNNRVQAFNAYTGKYLYEFGERGQGNSSVFNFPRGLGVGPDGDLYIPDDGHTRRIRPDGTFVARYSFRKDTGGLGVGGQGLAFAEDGRLFQANRGQRDSVFVIDTNTGDLLLEWGTSGTGPGELTAPSGIMLGPDGLLYIAAARTSNIQKFSQDGVYVAPWGPSGENYYGIVSDSERDVTYVSQGASVLALDPEGNSLFQWGSQGSGNGEFGGVILDMDVDRYGSIFLADTDNGRIQRFVYPPPPDPSAKGKPSFLAGTEEGVFVWKETFDGPYHLRVSSGGDDPQFEVTILASRPFNEVLPHNLAPDDDLTAEGNRLVLVARGSTSEPGADFTLPPGSRALIAVKRNGSPKPGILMAGAQAMRVPLGGWILPFASLPPQPSVRDQPTKGLFIGRGTAPNVLEARLSGGDAAQKFRVSILSSNRFDLVEPVSLEACCDALVTGSYLAEVSGRVAGSGWDGMNVGAIEEDAHVGFAYLQDGLFAAHDINPNIPEDLGVPNAHWMPGSSPRGAPSYSAASEAGLFVWRSDDGVWHLRGAPGGGSVRYQGSLVSSAPLGSVNAVKLETSDVMELADGGMSVRFDLRIKNSGIDGIDFVVPDGASLSLELEGNTAATLPLVRVGGEKWPVQGSPVVLSDGDEI